MTLKSLNKKIKGGLVGFLATGGTMFALPMDDCDGLAIELGSVLEEVISQLPTDEFEDDYGYEDEFGDESYDDKNFDYGDHDEEFDDMGYF